MTRAALLTTALILSACGTANDAPSADLVLINGNIQIDSGRSVSEVAITDGLISYVGDDASGMIGPGTAVSDLGERTVIPGIVDAHSHPGMVAMSIGVLYLDDVSTREALMASIRKLLTENPGTEPLIAGFWPNEHFGPGGPHKKDLDQIESERPVILYDTWAHTVWANTAALDHAGVTDETPDLVPGFSFYQRDESGEATGWITESAASVFTKAFAEITPDVEDALQRYLEYYPTVGVSAVYDAGNFGLDREILEVVARLEREGKLPVRYHGTYTLFNPHDLAGAVDEIKALGRDFNSEKIRVETMKLFFDGVLETRTAAIGEDYLDTPGNSGDALLTREQVHGLLVELEAEGLNLHVHAVGDRATNTILGAVEDLHATLQRAPTMRIAICHLEVVDELDVQRFSELGVIANFTPHWLVGGDMSWYEAGIGDKAHAMQRVGNMVESGAVVTFSSDITDKYEWHTDRANPFLGMEVGHNRQDVGVGDEGPQMMPREDRVARNEMLRGYTENAAYQLGLEAELGTIEVGKSADLAILDQNPLTVDRRAIHKTKVVMMIIDGEVVHGNLPAN